MSKLTTSLISDLHTFKSLKEEWNNLLDNSDLDSIFLTWEWLYTWWCKFGNNQKLNIITVRSLSGELIGIAPFYITRERGAIPKNTLTFLGTTDISSEYLDIISTPKYKNEIAAVIFNALHKPPILWECIVINDALDYSLAYTSFKNIAHSSGLIIKENASETCPYLTLADSRNEMLKHFKGQLRSTIKRRMKKLDKLDVTFNITEDADELNNHMQVLFDLHQKCWNIRGIEGSFKKENKRSFHMEVAKLFLQRDLLRLYTLNVNNETISALYSFQYKGKLFYFQSGFDPEWSSYSPGTLLMWKCIEDAISRNLDEFDYLRGTEHYKTLWANNSRETHYLILIPPRNIKAKTFFLIKDTKKRIKDTIKKLIRHN